MRALLLILACLAFSGGVFAQTQAPSDPAPIVAQAQTDIRAAYPTAHANTLTNREIRARLASLSGAQTALAGALAGLTPRVQDIKARLAQLGPAPAAGQPPEAPPTAATRQALGRAYATVDSEEKMARVLSVEADQATKQLVNLMHQNFAARLWARSQSVLAPSLWQGLATALPNDAARLAATVRDQGVKFAQASSRPGHGLWIAIGLIAGILLLGPARILLDRLGRRRAAAGATMTRLRRSALAIWLVAVATLMPLLAGEVVRGALLAAGALTSDFDELVRLAIRSLVFAAFLEGLGRALLSPGRPDWRLAPISDEAVSRVAPFPGLVGLVAGLAALISGANITLGASFATSVASDCVSVLAELVAVGAALLAVAGVRVAAASAAPDSARQGAARLPWVLAALCAWLALGGALLAVLTGYLALASFLTRETIWVAAVLASLFLAIRFTDDVFPALLSEDAPVGRAIHVAIGLSGSALSQIAVLASGLSRLVLLFLGWIAILLSVGGGVEDFSTLFSGAHLVLRIGQVTISPVAIFGAVGLFLAGLLATRAARGWLEARYLPQTRMDVGVRNSVAVAVSYLGVVTAVLLALAFLGLSFTQIAIFASALSVGIGFGLQSIISNFVSGLVLLAERPVKVGDWIAIGELEGNVKAINIRATEIEMADQSLLIVPNSDLISKVVRNTTHAGALGRAKIVLHVNDSADPGEVRDLILAHLTDHAEVLSEPRPAVYLTDARDGALEFTLIAYLVSSRMAFRVKSELLYQIVPDLRGRGFSLAGSSTVVHLGADPVSVAPGTPSKPTR